MKKLLIAALLTAATGAQAQPAPAPATPGRAATTPSPVPDTPKNWTSIVMTANVNLPVDQAWVKIGGNDYCAFIKYLGMNSCVLTVGTGDVGTNRLLNGRINELLFSRTSHSYIYAQPTSSIFYHGTMAVEPLDATHSRVVYTLLYDNAATPPEGRAAEMDGRRVRFQAAIDKMAAAANAP
jgi:hypothetical protein